jgi:hypothetical protein
MVQPQASSPFPPGTTVATIWVGMVLPDQKGAGRGETTVTYPDGRVEHTLFTTGKAER